MRCAFLIIWKEEGTSWTGKGRWAAQPCGAPADYICGGSSLCEEHFAASRPPTWGPEEYQRVPAKCKKEE